MRFEKEPKIDQHRFRSNFLPRNFIYIVQKILSLDNIFERKWIIILDKTEFMIIQK